MNLNVLLAHEAPRAESTLDCFEFGILSVILELVSPQVVRTVEHGHALVARVAQRARMDERVLCHDVLLGKRLRTVRTLERPANVQRWPHGCLFGLHGQDGFNVFLYVVDIRMVSKFFR